MPILGPGTVRSAGGFAVDTVVHSAAVTTLKNSTFRGLSDGTKNTILNSVAVLKAIDNRHQQPFRYHDSGYPFEYELVQFLYRQSREMQVMK
jgi:phospholipid-binding lipoprotein MlaA